jgi:hypothetical protein
MDISNRQNAWTFLSKFILLYDEKQLRDIGTHALLIPSASGRNYWSEELSSLMKNLKLRTRKRLADEHLEGCMRMAKKKLKMILKDYSSTYSV